MTAHGAQLGADLHKLWHAGTYVLPEGAAAYLSANIGVANTANSRLGDAFYRPLSFGHGAYGPVYAKFNKLRDQLQTILGDAARNLELVAQGLCRAAQDYADCDQEAADKFRQLVDEDQNVLGPPKYNQPDPAALHPRYPNTIIDPITPVDRPQQSPVPQAPGSWIGGRSLWATVAMQDPEP